MAIKLVFLWVESSIPALTYAHVAFCVPLHCTKRKCIFPKSFEDRSHACFCFDFARKRTIASRVQQLRVGLIKPRTQSWQKSAFTSFFCSLTSGGGCPDSNRMHFHGRTIRTIALFSSVSSFTCRSVHAHMARSKNENVGIWLSLTIREVCFLMPNRRDEVKWPLSLSLMILSTYGRTVVQMRSRNRT